MQRSRTHQNPEESEKEEVKPEELMKGSRRRQVSKARVETAIRCREELGLSGAEIARDLGGEHDRYQSRPREAEEAIRDREM